MKAGPLGGQGEHPGVAHGTAPAVVVEEHVGVLRRGDESGRKAAEVAALSGDLNYADWQREFLSLTTEE